MLPLYWIRSHNFGDILNPILYRTITGREPEFSDVSPKILAIGSVFDLAKPGDTVWGTGIMSASRGVNCDDTTDIRAVRGPMTEEILRDRGIKLPVHVPYGDPSILLPRFIKPSDAHSYKVGFLPHYIDYGQVGELPGGVMLLSPATEPLQLIEQITSCEFIISSSLHGICVAEAYGIPAVWVELSDLVEGRGFKFYDYFSGSGRVMLPLDWRQERDWGMAATLAEKWRKPEYDLERLYDACPYK